MSSALRPLLVFLVLELTSSYSLTTANCASTLTCAANRMLLLDWLNASKEWRDCCKQTGWNWIRTRPNSCGLDPDNSHRRSIQGPRQPGNTVSNFWHSQDPILVAWIQTTAIGDQYKDHDNRGTLYRIFDIRQNPILVARIQTTAIGDQYKDQDNRGTLYRIFDIRQDSRCDIPQWTRN